MTVSTKGVIASALALAIAMTPSHASATIKVGDRAPKFEMTLIDGSRISSTALHGQVVILNFWATWCGPCKAELPLLDTYYRLRKGNGCASSRLQPKTRSRRTS